ncbi:MAG: cell division protein FtsL [Rhodospirillales bacterium]|nr:cell division protein FtsL [Rhodospirillales bacterium]
MSRIAAAVFLMLAGLCALGTYVLKHEVQQREEALRAAYHNILRAQEELHVLKAEWSYLNQPERLAALARTQLGLAPLSPEQLVRVEDLPFRAIEQASGNSYPTPAGSAAGGLAQDSAEARQ